MKVCPILIAHTYHDADGLKRHVYAACISDECAWWVDEEASPHEHHNSAHHCGLIGRVWGRDDRAVQG